MKESVEKKDKKRLQHPVRLFAVIYVIVLAVLLGTIYFIPWLSDQTADIMTVKYGDFTDTRKMTCYFVKDEVVYFSDKSGTVGYSYAEGSRARSGSDIVSIKKSSVEDRNNYKTFDNRVTSFLQGRTFLRTLSKKEKDAALSDFKKQRSESESSIEKLQLKLCIRNVENAWNNTTDSSRAVKISSTGISGNYQTESSGIVSYRLDGYEALLNPTTMSMLDRSRISSISTDYIDTFSGTTSKGEPVFKIVSDSEWYALTWINLDKLNTFEEGGSVTLAFDDAEVTGSVFSIVEQENQALVIIKFTSYYQNLATLRKANVTIITKNASGLMVETSFIQEKYGYSGVNVLDVSGKQRFAPVDIIATDGDYSLVSAASQEVLSDIKKDLEEEEQKDIVTLEEFDEIIK